MVVSGEETVERGLRVPLELQQFPAGLELQGEAPSTVDVRVRGASGTLSRVGAGDVVAVLDLHAARAGPAAVSADARAGARAVRRRGRAGDAVDASRWRSSRRRRGRCRSCRRSTASPAPGYVVGKMTVDPPTVEVVGPESAVKRATEALTEPVSVAGAREHVTRDGDRRPAGSVAAAEDARGRRRCTVQILPGAARADAARTVRSTCATSAPNLDAQADAGRRRRRRCAAAARRSARVDADDVVRLRRSRRPRRRRLHAAGARRLARARPASTRIDPATVQVRITSGKN